MTRHHSSINGTPVAIGRKAIVLPLMLLSKSARNSCAVLVPASSCAAATNAAPAAAAAVAQARTALIQYDSCSMTFPPLAKLSWSPSNWRHRFKPLVALTGSLLVARVQPIVQDDGGEQHGAPDDVLHLAVDVHDGKGIEQGAD